MPIATGIPANQPQTNTSADVEESLEANSPHITIIATAKPTATIATVGRETLAAEAIRIAGPTLNTAGNNPAVSGLASDQSSVAHVHMLPIEEPTTAKQP